MNNSIYPVNTAAAVRLEALKKLEGKRHLSDRLSTRLVKIAAALNAGGHIGWQMYLPAKGLARLELFGSSEITKADLEWAAEETGRLSAPKGAQPIGLGLLCELFLPAAETAGKGAAIGFKSESSGTPEAALAKWPDSFAGMFKELAGALRSTGGMIRAVLGPASEEEQQSCRKNTLKGFDLSGSYSDYIGTPVKLRLLLKLPEEPSIRLKTVLSECVRGARLKVLGSMDEESAARIWNDPLNGAPVLPDIAARIMLLEPELYSSVIGIKTYQEKAKLIPAGHKPCKDRSAVEIGRAVDTSGIRRKIAVGMTDLRRHLQIVGQTGTGKSTMLASIILSAIKQGHGLTFFDPHGSTVDRILRCLPEKYTDRVRVVRLGSTDAPVPIGLWDSDDPLKEERSISDLCELFGDIFNPPNDIFVGPRYERWLSTFCKASIAFLGRRASLESITVLSQSRENMKKLYHAIAPRYPELAEIIWQEYISDRSQDFNSSLSWYLSKFQRLTSVVQLRETLGAGSNALDFAHTLDTDKATLIDLASPELGTQASRIVGTLLLMKLWNSALTRQDRDRTHIVAVDEAALFQTNPMPRMLAEARKFGIAMVLCHQHTGQLSPEVRDALEANSANFAAFRLSAGDAKNAAYRLDDPDMAHTLTRLDAFNAIATVSIDGRQTAPFTLEIPKLRQQKNGEEIAALVEERSIKALVDPYRKNRALTPAEIQSYLDDPEQLWPGWVIKCAAKKNITSSKNDKREEKSYDKFLDA